MTMERQTTDPLSQHPISTPTALVAIVVRCQCDRCIRWPLSEAPSTSRRWLAFEVRRPIDVIADVPASWTECSDVGRDPRTGVDAA
jgi:hypothetical protein